MKVAIYSGILTSNVDSATAFCPTGNCTWPITPSVAVCGSCSTIKYQTICKSDICFYTLPSGNTVNLTNTNLTYDDLSNTANSTDQQAVFQVVSNTQDTYTTTSYNDSLSDRLFIAKFEAFGAPYDPSGIAAISGDDLFSWSNSSTIASECALWMCVQTYNASQVDGIQTESITSEFSDLVGFNVAPHSIDNYTFLQPYSSYTVSSIATDAITGYIQGTDYFDGEIQLEGTSQNPSSDFVQAIWYASADPGGLNAWIQTLARTVTNVIRTRAPQSSGLYNGKAYQLGVRVRWPWVILPTSLVLSSLIILITTIVKTARSPVRAWKSSPLALLFMEVDRDITERATGQANRLNGLQKSTGKIEVMMRTDEQGDWIIKAA